MNGPLDSRARPRVVGLCLTEGKYEWSGERFGKRFVICTFDFSGISPIVACERKPLAERKSFLSPFVL